MIIVPNFDNYKLGKNLEDVLLINKVNCVLPVDLYDTTSEWDLHINQELMKVLTMHHKCTLT